MEKIKITCPHCFKKNLVPLQETYIKADCGHCKKSLLETNPVELTKSNFDNFMFNNELPIVLDFWAPWCGPCKMMAPIFKNTAKEFPLQVRFAKINTEKEPILARNFNIKSIPTLILFKKGREIRRISGVLDGEKLKRFLQ